MENPRPEKVAVVDEVRERFSGSEAALLTEYRGIDVTEMQVLRRSLRAAGGDYKVYKNTLVRFAVRELGLEIEDLLTGPIAIAFVPADGGGDPVTVAKALRDFAKGNPHLVVKGGVLGENILSEADARALADIAPRDELLAKLAGLMAAPMQQFAGLLQAVPRDFAYGLRALIDQGGAPGAPQSEPAAPAATATSTEFDSPAEPEAEAETAPDIAAEADQTQSADASSDAPAADAPDTDVADTDVAVDAPEQES
jgi:large subunit ribosomal protein L10